jgi:YD repeat-containing protein
MGYWYQDNVYPSLNHTAAHTYDSVNRLTSSVATGASTYYLNFSYDRYGNMTCVLNGNTQGYCPQFSYANSLQNNRITNSGVSYDGAGDLTGDGTNTVSVL